MEDTPESPKLCKFTEVNVDKIYNSYKKIKPNFQPISVSIYEKDSDLYQSFFVKYVSCDENILNSNQMNAKTFNINNEENDSPVTKKAKMN